MIPEKSVLNILLQNVVLPKLPVPALEQTLERYLATVKPIVGDGQYERTRSFVKSFGSSNGQGPRLQEKILQRQEEQDNWVSSITAIFCWKMKGHGLNLGLFIQSYLAI